MRVIDDYGNYIKLLTLFYIVVSAIKDSVDSLYIVMFFLMVVIFTFGASMVKGKLKKIILLFEGSILIYFSLNIISGAIILLPVVIIEILEDIKIKGMLSFIVISLVIFIFEVKVNYLNIYICTMLYLIYFKMVNELKDIKENLPIVIERQRTDIANLNRKIKKQSEYRKQSIYTYKLKERNEMSKRVHDRVGHTIAGSLLQLEATKIVLDKDINKGKEMIDSTIDVLRSGMDDIRKTLRTINPSDEQIGINKIKLILAEKTQNTPFTYSVISNGDIDKISKIQWKFFVDVVMESSTNTLKYSKGTHITVKIEVFNKMIKLQMKDNGVGCNLIKKGIGISSIEQEAIELGGKVVLNGTKGFEVVVLMPII
ncbi:MAG: sensor histidine kinase [Clostridium sp.]